MAARLMFVALLLGLSVSAVALTDPTRPASYRGEGGYVQGLKANYRLNSIIFGVNRRSAVINGTRVVEGEKLGDALVRSITKNNVVLVVKGVEVRIAQTKANIKKQAGRE